MREFVDGRIHSAISKTRYTVEVEHDNGFIDAELDRLAAMVEKLEAELAELDQNISEISIQLSDARTALSQTKDDYAALDALEVLTDAQEAEKAALKAEIDDITENVSDLERELGVHKQKRSEIKTEISALRLDVKRRENDRSEASVFTADTNEVGEAIPTGTAIKLLMVGGVQTRTVILRSGSGASLPYTSIYGRPSNYLFNQMILSAGRYKWEAEFCIGRVTSAHSGAASVSIWPDTRLVIKGGKPLYPRGTETHEGPSAYDYKVGDLALLQWNGSGWDFRGWYREPRNSLTGFSVITSNLHFQDDITGIWRNQGAIGFKFGAFKRYGLDRFGLSSTTFDYSGLERYVEKWGAYLKPVINKRAAVFGLEFDYVWGHYGYIFATNGDLSRIKLDAGFFVSATAPSVEFVMDYDELLRQAAAFGVADYALVAGESFFTATHTDLYPEYVWRRGNYVRSGAPYFADNADCTGLTTAVPWVAMEVDSQRVNPPVPRLYVNDEGVLVNEDFFQRHQKSGLVERSKGYYTVISFNESTPWYNWSCGMVKDQFIGQTVRSSTRAFHYDVNAVGNYEFKALMTQYGGTSDSDTFSNSDLGPLTVTLPGGGEFQVDSFSWPGVNVAVDSTSVYVGKEPKTFNADSDGLPICGNGYGWTMLPPIGSPYDSLRASHTVNKVSGSEETLVGAMRCESADCGGSVRAVARLDYDTAKVTRSVSEIGVTLDAGNSDVDRWALANTLFVRDLLTGERELFIGSMALFRALYNHNVGPLADFLEYSGHPDASAFFANLGLSLQNLGDYNGMEESEGYEHASDNYLLPVEQMPGVITIHMATAPGVNERFDFGYSRSVMAEPDFLTFHSERQRAREVELKTEFLRQRAFPYFDEAARLNQELMFELNFYANMRKFHRYITVL